MTACCDDSELNSTFRSFEEIFAGFTIIGNFGSGTQCYYVVSASESFDYIYTIDDVLQDFLCNESICTDYCPTPTPTPTISESPTPTVTPTITETSGPTPTPTISVTPTLTRTPTSSPAIVYNSLGLLATGFNNRTDYDQPSTTGRLSIICNGVRTLGGGQLPGTNGHVYYTGDCSTITSSVTAPGKTLFELQDGDYIPLTSGQSVTNGCQGWLLDINGVILSTYPSFCSGGSSGCVQCGS